MHVLYFDLSLDVMLVSWPFPSELVKVRHKRGHEEHLFKESTVWPAQPLEILHIILRAKWCLITEAPQITLLLDYVVTQCTNQPLTFNCRNSPNLSGRAGDDLYIFSCQREQGDAEKTGYLQTVSFIIWTLLKLQTWKRTALEAALITQTIMKFI